MAENKEITLPYNLHALRRKIKKAEFPNPLITRLKFRSVEFAGGCGKVCSAEYAKRKKVSNNLNLENILLLIKIVISFIRIKFDK